MKLVTYLIAVISLLVVFVSCKDNDDTEPPIPRNFALTNISLDGRPLSFVYASTSIQPEIKLSFDAPIDHESALANITMGRGTGPLALNITFEKGDSTIVIKPVKPLNYLTTYSLFVSTALASQKEQLYGSTIDIKVVTTYDPADKFPSISDDALFDLVQEKTFRYFWDFAHPASGMARERNSSGNTVTTGGSGFGLMAIIVGIEREIITRAEGVERLDKILAFLETADRFHGAWPHWVDGQTGKVIPFSANDNGGDLVETSLLVQGLIAFRQYLHPENENEQALIDRINVLWKGVEWDWYTKGNEKVLYWHWSPDKAWSMNLQIRGANECLITYVLAAASPEHSIDADVYTEGYARNGNIRNGKKFYDITLPIGSDYGGPLFFTHYSFLGLNPKNLKDQFADYWEQNVNHSKINYAYCVDNPKNYAGYGEDCWGLTASDNYNGYSAHSPTNDLSVISPTAALSSFPYTPEESMRAMKFFYYKLGDKLFDDYGFYDAFSLERGWIANSYLAIDQGPIIVMIENHRTQLLWNLFMSAPEVQAGLTKLGFTY
ncbi:glucoamylase family protein [Pseudochryseolinea flava]|uniref:Beta-glucosidase n=1 Tax=Pseudochryseolinea flava TaxID=2059302 RepID=A0A364Y1T7_9BACT|nr:glucoamylase family protein [Pseudochryseolinea flava]RAW00674.1 beta-glucosidase [Pseudochryseolinea flava]